MTASLVGRVAVVTGGASGIGRATVLRFLDAGARVLFGDLNEPNSEALVEEVGDPARLRYLPADVSVESDVAALVETAARGAFLGTKHGARLMTALGNGGSIINDSSVAGLTGGAGPIAYSAAKAAVLNFTANTAVELAPHRIRVNAICPGLIDTPMVMGADPAALAERLATFQPWPDLGQPGHIASIALFLAGPDSEFVTGAAIRADGGMLAWGPRMEGAHDQSGDMRSRSSTAAPTSSPGRPG